MILNAVDVTSVAKSLVFGVLVGGQLYRSYREIKYILVPVNGLLVARQSSKKGIMLTSLRHVHLEKAHFGHTVLLHRAIQRPDWHLTPQTNSQEGYILCTNLL